MCEIDGKTELWIIDFKTSNHLQTTYDLQTAFMVNVMRNVLVKKQIDYMEFYG
jgi:hypothetical protein